MRAPGRGFLDRYPADLAEWQDDERLVSRGFVHGWRSQVAPGNGEAFFDALVRSLVSPSFVVADIGCGHGGYAQTLAPLCRHVIGVDGDPGVIDLARQLATERGVANIDFRVLRLDEGAGENGAGENGAGENGAGENGAGENGAGENGAGENGAGENGAGSGLSDGGAGVGVPDASVDVFVCRRGPILTKWLDPSLRAARPGAVAVGMHPTGPAGAVPPWNADLPEPLRIERVFGYDEVRGWVTSGIDQAAGRIHLDGCWWFDVAETFDEPAELYAKLAGRRGGVPSWPAVKEDLTRLFTAYGGTLELRHCRLVWQASFR
ncbi:methyltransferase domain-containing protein [Actinopolymorpha sp. B17G11]|uniref:class I SAM-dependent methyltransferase n=1 Tax=Actinopolymorpha sp. B17G11 TaxID=3160861 RepID=UPI0032E37A81